MGWGVTRQKKAQTDHLTTGLSSGDPGPGTLGLLSFKMCWGLGPWSYLGPWIQAAFRTPLMIWAQILNHEYQSSRVWLAVHLMKKWKHKYLLSISTGPGCLLGAGVPEITSREELVYLRCHFFLITNRKWGTLLVNPSWELVPLSS